MLHAFCRTCMYLPPCMCAAGSAETTHCMLRNQLQISSGPQSKQSSTNTAKTTAHKHNCGYSNMPAGKVSFLDLHAWLSKGHHNTRHLFTQRIPKSPAPQLAMLNTSFQTQCLQLAHGSGKERAVRTANIAQTQHRCNRKQNLSNATQ